MESIESKIRLLYNKKSKEMMIVVSDVEEGSETYTEVRKLVKNLVEIELKKVVGGTEELNLEKAEDITPMPVTSTKCNEVTPAMPTEVATTEGPIEAETSSVEATEATPVEAEVTPVETKEESEPTTVESPTEDLTPKSDDPTFLIKAGDTQLSVKDFAEANRLFQPKFMTGGKFRVAPNEIAIYEKAGYVHP